MCSACLVVGRYFLGTRHADVTFFQETPNLPICTELGLVLKRVVSGIRAVAPHNEIVSIVERNYGGSVGASRICRLVELADAAKCVAHAAVGR